MEDTWACRELPVLQAAVAMAEEGKLLLYVEDIAERTGLDTKDIGLSVLALDGEYVDLHRMGPLPGAWYLRGVKPAARRAVGQWPTPETLVDQLAAAFTDAADKEPDAEKKSRLRQVASVLGTTGRDVTTEIVSKVILHSIGMG